jgi:hypothetical protein
MISMPVRHEDRGLSAKLGAVREMVHRESVQAVRQVQQVKRNLALLSGWSEELARTQRDAGRCDLASALSLVAAITAQHGSPCSGSSMPQSALEWLPRIEAGASSPTDAGDALAEELIHQAQLLLDAHSWLPVSGQTAPLRAAASLLAVSAQLMEATQGYTAGKETS